MYTLKKTLKLEKLLDLGFIKDPIFDYVLVSPPKDGPFEQLKCIITEDRDVWINSLHEKEVKSLLDKHLKEIKE